MIYTVVGNEQVQKMTDVHMDHVINNFKMSENFYRPTFNIILYTI